MPIDLEPSKGNWRERLCRQLVRHGVLHEDAHAIAQVVELPVAIRTALALADVTEEAEPSCRG